MRKLLHKLSFVTRANDWRLSFVPFVMGCVYLWLWWFNLPFNGSVLLFTLLSLITTVGFASLGYFINEFFDKESDAKAGKINKLAYLSPTFHWVLLAVSLLFTFIPWIWLPTTHFSWLLILLQIIFFLLYSMPFPRLKDHAFLSVILDAIYAYVLPLFLSFYTFSLIAKKNDLPVWFCAFSVAAFFIGLRNVVIHQVRDVFRDAMSGTKTLPIVLGVALTKLIVVTALLYEILFWLIAGILLTAEKHLFAIYLTFHVLLVAWAFLQTPLNSYDPQKDQLFINRTYLYLFPVTMLILLAVESPFWLAILVLHLALLFPFYIIEKTILCMKYAYFQIKTFMMVEVRDVVSKIVNYPIYFAFKIVGIDLIKEKKSAADVLFRRKKQG